MENKSEFLGKEEESLSTNLLTKSEPSKKKKKRKPKKRQSDSASREPYELSSDGPVTPENSQTGGDPVTQEQSVDNSVAYECNEQNGSDSSKKKKKKNKKRKPRKRLDETTASKCHDYNADGSVTPDNDQNIGDDFANLNSEKIDCDHIKLKKEHEGQVSSDKEGNGDDPEFHECDEKNSDHVAHEKDEQNSDHVAHESIEQHSDHVAHESIEQQSCNQVIHERDEQGSFFKRIEKDCCDDCLITPENCGNLIIHEINHLIFDSKACRNDGPILDVPVAYESNERISRDVESREGDDYNGDNQVADKIEQVKNVLISHDVTEQNSCGPENIEEEDTDESQVLSGSDLDGSDLATSESNEQNSGVLLSIENSDRIDSCSETGESREYNNASISCENYKTVENEDSEVYSLSSEIGGRNSNYSVTLVEEQVGGVRVTDDFNEHVGSNRAIDENGPNGCDSSKEKDYQNVDGSVAPKNEDGELVTNENEHNTDSEPDYDELKNGVAIIHKHKRICADSETCEYEHRDDEDLLIHERGGQNIEVGVAPELDEQKDKEHVTLEQYDEDREIHEEEDEDSDIQEKEDKDRGNLELCDEDYEICEENHEILEENHEILEENHEIPEENHEILEENHETRGEDDEDSESREEDDKDSEAVEQYDGKRESLELCDEYHVSLEQYDENYVSLEQYEEDHLFLEQDDKDRLSLELYNKNRVPRDSDKLHGENQVTSEHDEETDLDRLTLEVKDQNDEDRIFLEYDDNYLVTAEHGEERFGRAAVFSDCNEQNVRDQMTSEQDEQKESDPVDLEHEEQINSDSVCSGYGIQKDRDPANEKTINDTSPAVRYVDHLSFFPTAPIPVNKLKHQDKRQCLKRPSSSDPSMPLKKRKSAPKRNGIFEMLAAVPVFSFLLTCQVVCAAILVIKGDSGSKKTH